MKKTKTKKQIEKKTRKQPKKKINRNKNMKMSMKMQLIVECVVPIVAVILVGIISYHQAEAGMIQNFEQAAWTSIETKIEYLDYGFELLSSDATQISLDDELGNLTAGVYINDQLSTMNIQNDMESEVKVKAATNSFISSIYMIPVEDMEMISSDGRKMSGFYKSWAESEEGLNIQNQESEGWIGKHPFIDEKLEIEDDMYALSYIKILRNKQACIVIDVSKELIQESMRSLDLGEGAIITFMTQDGYEITVAENEETIPEDYQAKALLEDSTDDMACSYTTVNGEEYLLLYNESEESGITICAVVPSKTVLAGTEGIRRITVIAVITATVLVLLFGSAILFNLSSSISYIIKKLRAVSKGDLTVQMNVKGTNEFAKLSEEIEEMVQNTRGLILRVGNTTELVASASLQVGAVTETIQTDAKGITETMINIDSGVASQAEDAQNCLAKMDELSAQIQKITENIEKVSKVQKENEKLIVKGLGTMDELKRTSNSTSEVTLQVGQDVQELEKNSARISEFVGVIHEITEETNLLSLNASIEAARAGEQGKGFAVVAQEIRGLADASKGAATEIQKIVNVIANQTKETRENTNRAQKIVAEQELKVEDTLQVFKDIRIFMDRLFHEVEEIRVYAESAEGNRTDTLNAIENISSVLEETTASISIVTDTTKQQSDVAEDLGITAESLNEKLIELKKAIEKFEI